MYSIAYVNIQLKLLHNSKYNKVKVIKSDIKKKRLNLFKMNVVFSNILPQLNYNEFEIINFNKILKCLNIISFQSFDITVEQEKSSNQFNVI